jgi:hypothetical protein
LLVVAAVAQPQGLVVDVAVAAQVAFVLALLL